MSSPKKSQCLSPKGTGADTKHYNLRVTINTVYYTIDTGSTHNYFFSKKPKLSFFSVLHPTVDLKGYFTQPTLNF